MKLGGLGRLVLIISKHLTTQIFAKFNVLVYKTRIDILFTSFKLIQKQKLDMIPKTIVIIVFVVS